MTKVFVGNLSFLTPRKQLAAAFGKYGKVERVEIVADRLSGQPRGFAFVEIAEPSAAATSIARLNGVNLNGQAMNVNEARPKPSGDSSFRGALSRGGRGASSRGSRW